MGKIQVCDAPMGFGKTSAAIAHMNNNPQKKFIFITPYLAEVERIKSSCKALRFVSPEPKGCGGKLAALHELLKANENIASTHALLSGYTEETATLIREGGYTLIVDEVHSVVNPIDVHVDDLNVLANAGYVDVDEANCKIVVKDPIYYKTSFYDSVSKLDNSSLLFFKRKIMFWLFPIDVFDAFQRTIILTYMFEAQMHCYYYKMNNRKYEYIGVKQTDNCYEFVDQPCLYQLNIRSKIHILDDIKLNNIDKKPTALSSSWYMSANKEIHKPKFKQIKNNIRNVFVNRHHAKSSDVMWTTFAQHEKHIRGAGFGKSFVACNARATNAHSGRHYLAYCVNRYFNPFMKQYFNARGVSVNEDQYALCAA